MVKTNLGPVTAYAHALAQGYTGTKEEFSRELAELAKNAQKLAQDRAAAEEAAKRAEKAAASAEGTLPEALAGVPERLNGIEREINLLHPLAITSFSVSPAMAEKGSTVNKEAFSYRVNRMNATLTLDGTPVTGENAERTDALTADKTYTLTATLGDTRVEATAKITFVAPVYYGASESYALANDTVLALTRVLTTTRARTISVNAGAGQYILYALPEAMGTPAFKVGGFEGGFELAGTFSFTNASGYTESYSLYRSVNAGLGSTTVTIG